MALKRIFVNGQRIEWNEKNIPEEELVALKEKHGHGPFWIICVRCLSQNERMQLGIGEKQTIIIMDVNTKKISHCKNSELFT